MLEPRTKLLIMLSALAPASILILVVNYDTAFLQSKSEGFRVWVHVEPSVLYSAMFCVGCIAFLLAIVSTILDVRRSRS
jgi:hypothetical protein